VNFDELFAKYQTLQRENRELRREISALKGEQNQLKKEVDKPLEQFETKAEVSMPESNPGLVINSGLDSTGIPRQIELASSSQNTAIPQEENSGYYGWLSIVWLIGVLIVILYLALVNTSISLRLKKGKKSNEQKVVQAVEQCKLEVGVHSEIPVYCSDQIKTPSLFGLIKPKLLLPQNMLDYLTAEEMRYVFLHE